MAEDSLRERIILADVAIVDNMSVVKHSIRTIPSFSDLENNFGSTQIPVAAIVGRLPVPEPHRAGRNGHVDQYRSLLRVDIYFYFLANKDQDSILSNYLDEFWRLLHENPTRDISNVETTWLEVTEDNEVWPPYMAFKITCVHRYIHTIGGI